MMRLTCDLCGKTLLIDEDVRYIVNIEVFAAYDPMELTEEDLRKDYRKELQDLVRRLEEMDPEKAQDSVYRKFEFQLCPKCQRKYLEDPLGRTRDREDSEEEKN